MKPESRFSRKVVKELRAHGLYVVRTQAGSISGEPDLFICAKGRFVAWELKDNGKKPTKLQEHQLHLIRESGGEATVVTPKTYKEELKKLLEQ